MSERGRVTDEGQGLGYSFTPVPERALNAHALGSIDDKDYVLIAFLCFEALVEKAAGWPCFAELEAERDIQRTVEEVRRDGLPKRLEYAEIGSVHLPQVVFAWLTESRDGRWTIADVAALAMFLHSFDLRDASVFQRAQFEDDVLVFKGELRFASGMNPAVGDTGSSQVRPDLAALVRNGWFDVAKRDDGRSEVR